MLGVLCGLSQRTLRLKAFDASELISLAIAIIRRFVIIVDDALYPVFKLNHVKVDQEPDVKIQQSQVRQQLGLVYGRVSLHLISTTTLPSMTKSARKPHSNFTVSYTSGTAFCRCT